MTLVFSIKHSGEILALRNRIVTVIIICHNTVLWKET